MVRRNVFGEKLKASGEKVVDKTRKWAVVDDGVIVYTAETKAEAEGFAGPDQKVKKTSNAQSSVQNDMDDIFKF